MKLTINDEVKEFKDGINISELLKLEDVKNPDMLSVVINDGFVHKDNYETQVLNDGDVVGFLYFMGGGSGV